MKRWLLLLLFVCLVAAGLLCLLPSTSRLRVHGRESAESYSVSATNSQAQLDSQPSLENAAASQPAVEQARSSTASSADTALGVAISSAPADTNGVAGEPAIPPETVLENVRTTIRQYGFLFGGNPVGTNPEITSALNGANPKHVKFLRIDAGLQVNEKGELVDPWGTPYFFHQLSRTQMEIRSAGPDRVMWTGDDLVIR
jgi:hypothetical protein